MLRVRLPVSTLKRQVEQLAAGALESCRHGSSDRGMLSPVASGPQCHLQFLLEYPGCRVRDLVRYETRRNRACLDGNPILADVRGPNKNHEFPEPSCIRYL